jgi:protein-tyrosine phosphatase
METSSYFIKNKAIFGSYPCQETIKDLIHIGVNIFVDLTCEDEELPNYSAPDSVKIKYPIKDRYIPTDTRSFSHFIISLSKIIKEIPLCNKIYIHCKGGHGRSGLVVACLICQMFSLTPFESLKYTSECHNKRKVMKEKWRKIGAPQTTLQKRFVHQLFKSVNYVRMCRGVFCLSSNQFQFMFMEKEWSSVEECLKYVLETEKKVDDVDFVFLEGIIKERINQNEDLQVYLRNTNLRPVITYESSQKSKKICEILSKIRLSLLIF